MLNVNKLESDLITDTCLNIESLHRNYYNILDTTVPAEARHLSIKSHSTEELNNLAAPEHVDAVVGKLHIAQKL